MKKLIKTIFKHLGIKIEKTKEIGENPFADMKSFAKKSTSLLVFDIGAHKGESIELFRKHFPSTIIHSFEPNKDTFIDLKNNVSNLKNIHPWNLGIGSATGEIKFYTNTRSDMSSFLPLGKDGWGSESVSTAKTITIDQFCANQNIQEIDILKMDAQGFELEILKGAEQMLENNKIRMIYCETIFNQMYEDLPAFGSIFNHIVKKGYSLVSIYDIYYQNNLASYSDLLFVNNKVLGDDERDK